MNLTTPFILNFLRRCWNCLILSKIEINFILTTHELQLLNSKLRTDQIYLVEKDFQGKSSLKSIFDFNDSRNSSRQDVQFMKKYIEGRFGALPQIDVDEMLKSLNSKSFSSKDN
jgi:hypothetical protein